MFPRRQSGLRIAFPQVFSYEGLLEMLVKAERVRVYPQSVFMNFYFFVEELTRLVECLKKKECIRGSQSDMSVMRVKRLVNWA
jgi:hypothetical protein